MNQESEIRRQLRAQLLRKDQCGLRRSLEVRGHLADFSSNDYLGLARGISTEDKRVTYENRHSDIPNVRGATGSRLISGHSRYYQQVENLVAEFHHSESALLFSSGYLANISLIQSLVTRHTTILYDKLIHASLRDGIRLSGAKAYSFVHNDCHQLEQYAQRYAGSLLIVIESLYSMDGDLAPLEDILLIAERYGAEVVVDEAHAIGVLGHEGRGLASLNDCGDRILARTVTFGKALGCHGAAIISDSLVRDSIINTARGFIFSTALPPHALWEIERSYRALPELTNERASLLRNCALFNTEFPQSGDAQSPIKRIIIPGNEAVVRAAKQLQDEGFSVVPIRAPTVPAGQERLRICLHSFNSEKEMHGVMAVLHGLKTELSAAAVCNS